MAVTDLVQHAIVTLIALGAAWVIVRKVLGTFGPVTGTRPACPTCASGCGHAAGQRQGR